MNPFVSKLAGCFTLLTGMGIWVVMAQKFDDADRLSYEPNVACLKGSPYGKILALAMQGPIDFYWHKGTTHEHADLLSADHGHDHGHDHGQGGECTDGCEDHGDHHAGHNHAEHHHHDHAGHDHHASHEHGEDCDCGAHGEQASPAAAGHEGHLHARAKMKIRKMEAAAHRKTDGKPLSAAHQQYLQGVTEDKLRLAYELDPSNYTNYGNYHLFLATTTYGRNEGDDNAAVALARRTLKFCKRDQRDPASWVTAASAAYNIIYHIGRYHENYSIPEAKASLAEFDHCIREYVRLRQLSVREARIMSQERLEEMETRVNYLSKLRYAQGVYMKRVMSAKMARVDNNQGHTH